MTQVEARLHHTPLEPTEQAVHVTEHQRAQQGIPRSEDIKRACEEEAKRTCEETAAKDPGNAIKSTKAD
jgi:hypothetical protein